ncbi:putative MFS-type transporter [Hyphodiscus hymeniophilus]|uniref:MFS-type transporter n=1 Tax=Hyphodiscus hymeniophilus TaxID=353542 RepID=A0A9P6VQR1_9HELO|nr:putative MFS-type transporter [Hyphodiscus hymeniophilus]
MAEALMSQNPNARPKHFNSNIQEYIFVFTVMMAAASTTFLQGVTVMNTATIGKDMNMTAAEITWISAALGLSSGSFVLFFGKTADLFGRKIQLLAGLAFLSLFALITSFAPNGISLNILLGFLGLGTAAIAPPSVGILFTTYPPGRRRNLVTGALGCGNPVGFVIGSISSGVATKYFSWRASFIVVAIFFFIMTGMAFWTVPSIPRAGSLRRMVRQFDYLGTVLTVIGMAIISAALTEGPEEGWKAPKVIVMLVLGIALLFCFVIWENIYTHPLLDPSIWRNRDFNLCIICVFFGYMSFITNQFWISLYMQNIQMMTPLTIAARILPQTVTGIIWSYLGQALLSRVTGTVVMGVGALAYIAGAALLIFIRQNTSYWALLFPSLCITVMGADFQFIAANLYINTQMPEQSSLGAGVLQTAMRLSISLGLAVTTAVYGTTSQTPRGILDVDFPYERAYLCTVLFAVVGFLVVLFMRIGKQDGKPESGKPKTALDERPRAGGEYSDRSSGEHDIGHYHEGHSVGSSTLSVNTMATTGSQGSFFPRWSWEDQDQWIDKYYREPKVVYEVCIKCLEERRVVVQESGDPDISEQHSPRLRQSKRRENAIEV